MDRGEARPNELIEAKVNEHCINQRSVNLKHQSNAQAGKKSKKWIDTNMTDSVQTETTEGKIIINLFAPNLPGSTKEDDLIQKSLRDQLVESIRNSVTSPDSDKSAGLTRFIDLVVMYFLWMVLAVRVKPLLSIAWSNL